MIKIVCTLVALLVLAVVSSVNAQSGSDPCPNYNTIAQCAAATAQTNPLLCVWDDSQGCITDPCLNLGDNMTCTSSNYGCLWMGWSHGASCFASSLLCSNLGVGSCSQYPFCTVRENTYCGTVGVIGVNKVVTECDIKFPGWSVALIIVWLIIMVILGFIVLLAMGKSKTQKVTGIEQDDQVVVDSVQIRDNFQLGDPLNHGNDE